MGKKKSSHSLNVSTAEKAEDQTEKDLNGKSALDHNVNDYEETDDQTKEDSNGQSALAHNLNDTNILRTDDILTSDDVEFKNLLLPEFILHGLTAANFHRPSPIQLRSIPLLRLGLDLVVQSKAGTGKTLVITLAALETVKVESKRLQVIVIAPTREIALQTKQFISIISSDVAVRTEVFIGGTSVREDKKKTLGCQIAIGTPGRLNNLIATGDLLLGYVRLFVLDEADKLMEDSIFSQVKSVSKLLPPSKQTILCSATFLNSVRDYVVKHMKEPFWVTPEQSIRFQEGVTEQQKSVSTVLLGVTQYVKEVSNHPQIVRKLRYKLEEILEILSGHSFQQCMIFSNYQTRAETICHQLVSNGWPAMSVRGQDDQTHRTATLNSFKELKCCVLLTTDVMSRGVDFRGVDLVINLDIPYDSSTYLHRMGRAGRFGSYGNVITLASEGEEMESFKKILLEVKDTTVYFLPSDLRLKKQDSRSENIFFGSLTKPETGNDIVKAQDSRSQSFIKEESNRDCEPPIIAQLEIETGTSGEVVKVTEGRESGDQAKEENTDLNVEDVACEGKKAELMETLSELKVHDDNATPPALNLSAGSRRENIVQEAKAHLAQSLCAPRQKSLPFLSYDELEVMCSSWKLDENESKSKNPPSNDLMKRKDWWASAKIVLTAADLESQQLQEEAMRKTHPSQNEELSGSSSESFLNIQHQKRSNRSGGQRWREKSGKMSSLESFTDVELEHSSKHQEKKKTKERLFMKPGSEEIEEKMPHEKFTWLWDTKSRLYYIWDHHNSCYHLYNPYVKSYFKWEPTSNSYFKWDSVSQTYRLWDCESCCYLGTKENKNYPSLGNIAGANCKSWFTLWNKHLQQISWQVYQVEYMQNILGKNHHL